MTNSKAGKKVAVHLKLRISSTSNWNNYQNNLKFHDRILPHVKEIHGQQKGCIFLNKNQTKHQNANTYLINFF